MDDDGGDMIEISLKELYNNNLINIEPSKICLYAIYITYQYSPMDKRANNIYKYFDNENFTYISIEDSFKLGTEILDETNLFWDEWIKLLIMKEGTTEYRLLKEAIEFNNYNYEKYVKDFYKNHPKLYLDIFDYLITIDNINELIKIGNVALSKIDKKLTIRNDIALVLARFDDINKEEYLLDSFNSNTNIPNLLHLINNNLFKKYNKEIENTIESIKNSKKKLKDDFFDELSENILDTQEKHYLDFFIGNFEDFFKYCKDNNISLGWSCSFIKYGVYLWLLFFNQNINTIASETILKDTLNNLIFNKKELFLDEDYKEIWNKWRNYFEVDDKDKKKIIKWLEEIIGKRVEAIIEGNYRKSYYKVAILIVALGEVFESNNIATMDETIAKYEKKYSRRSSFRKELEKYKMVIK